MPKDLHVNKPNGQHLKTIQILLKKKWINCSISTPTETYLAIKRNVIYKIRNKYLSYSKWKKSKIEDYIPIYIPIITKT